jgi:hypothetical protein
MYHLWYSIETRVAPPRVVDERWLREEMASQHTYFTG